MRFICNGLGGSTCPDRGYKRDSSSTVCSTALFFLSHSKMRLLLVLLALSAFTASSLVGRQNLPGCALPCVANAATFGCSSTDNSCLCHNQGFVNSSTTCIEQRCSGNDLTQAEEFSQAICLSVGVTLTLSSPTSTSTSSASGATASSRPTSDAMHHGVSLFVGIITAFTSVILGATV